MGQDQLYVVDLDRVPDGVVGHAREKACWDARVAVPGLDADVENVARIALIFDASWSGAIEFVDGREHVPFDTTREGFREPDGSLEPMPLLGLLEDWHLDAMVASLERARDRPPPGGEEEVLSAEVMAELEALGLGGPIASPRQDARDQLCMLRTLQAHLRAHPRLRAAYHVDF